MCDEGADGLISYCSGDFTDAHVAFGQQGTGAAKAQLLQVLIGRHAGFLAENADNVFYGKVKGLADIFQTDGLAIMHFKEFYGANDQRLVTVGF